MGILVRAVVSGFGFSLGAALFKRVSSRLGLDDKDSKDSEKAAAADRDNDGELGDDEAEAER